MKAIRIGVMGCASIADRMVIPAIKALDCYTLVAIASRSREKAEKFALKFQCEPVLGYQALLDREDIDAIYMPLPTGLHFEWLSKAIDAGKHVLVEKSFAKNLTEAISLVEAACSRKLVVKENYMFEYHSQQSQVVNTIKDFAGDVRLFRANFGFPPLDKANFRYDKSLGGGALLDAGGYVLKSLKVFFPKADFKIKSSTLDYDNCGVDIAGTATVHIITDGCVIPAHLGFGFDHFYQCNIEAWGSKAKLSTNRSFTAGSDFSPEISVHSADGKVIIEMDKDDHFKNILVEFYHGINNRSGHIEGKAILAQAKLQQDLREMANT